MLAVQQKEGHGVVKAHCGLKNVEIVTLQAFFSELAGVIILVTGQAAIAQGYESDGFSSSRRKARCFALVTGQATGQRMFPQQWIA